MTETLTRAAPISAASYDPDSRTFTALISSGAPVQRTDARGSYIEKLDLSGVDLGALTGTPLLDAHRQDGSERVVGVLVSARRDAEGIHATFKLSAAADAESIVTKVAEGILRGLSIGYAAADRREAVGAGQGQKRERIVIIVPQIRETSLVAVPADPAAVIRSQEMENEQQPAVTTVATVANDNLIAHRAEVRAIATRAGLAPEWADTQIDSGADLATVKAAAFDAQAATRTAPVIRTQGAANDDPSVILQRRADALFARVNGSTPEDAARQYMGASIADHAAAILALRGVSTTGMDRETILRTAQHSTSDFPNLLTGVGNRTLLPAYEAAASPLKQLARQALLNDFRTTHRLKLGEIGALQKVSESGEIKATSRGEAAEAYALDTYGSVFSLSRKALISDDLGAFRDWGVAAGRAAAATEGDLLFSVLTASSGAGPVMGEDGKRLFHADHGNLAAAGAAPSETTLSAARQALRSMKGLGGSAIAATPAFVLCGPALETPFEKLLTAIQATAAADVNPFGGKLDLLVENRITGNGWYVFADPAQLAVLEYAYYSSAQGPQMASREGWDVLGTEFRVTLDFGAGAIDYRGAYRNAGA